MDFVSIFQKVRVLLLQNHFTLMSTLTFLLWLVPRWICQNHGYPPRFFKSYRVLLLQNHFTLMSTLTFLLDEICADLNHLILKKNGSHIK
jgi:hypothetical protein